MKFHNDIFLKYTQNTHKKGDPKKESVFRIRLTLGLNVHTVQNYAEHSS